MISVTVILIMSGQVWQLRETGFDVEVMHSGPDVDSDTSNE